MEQQQQAPFFKRIEFNETTGKIIRGRLQLENENYDDLERIERKKEMYAYELQEQMMQRQLERKNQIKQKQIENKKVLQLEEEERQKLFLEMKNKNQGQQGQNSVKQDLKETETQNISFKQQQQGYQQALKSQLEKDFNKTNNQQFARLAADKNYLIASEQVSLFNAQNKIKQDLDNLKNQVQEMKREKFNTERNYLDLKDMLKSKQFGNDNQNSLILSMPIKGVTQNYAINVIPSGLNDATALKQQFKFSQNYENTNEYYESKISPNIEEENTNLQENPSQLVGKTKFYQAQTNKPSYLSEEIERFPIVNHFISSGDAETDDMLGTIQDIQNLIKPYIPLGNLKNELIGQQSKSNYEQLKNLLPKEQQKINDAMDYVEEELEILLNE